MTALLLSGFAFPVRNMPAVVQYLTRLNPVGYFMEIARGISRARGSSSCDRNCSRSSHFIGLLDAGSLG